MITPDKLGWVCRIRRMSDTEAHDQLAEARGRIAARDWEGALAALAEAEGRAPETWFLRGVAREALGDHGIGRAHV